MTDWLLTRWQHLVTWMLQIEPPSSGSGMNWRIEGTWSWSPTNVLLLALLVGAAGAIAVGFYVKEKSTAGRVKRSLLVVLRILVVLAILFMVYDARLIREETSLPYLVVLIDDSASMDTIDRYDEASMRAIIDRELAQVKLEQPSRVNLAKSILLRDDARALQRLSKQYKLQVYKVAATTRRLDGELPEIAADIRKLQATGQASRLGAGVKTIFNELRGTQPAAILVLSDGITTEGPGLVEAAVYARRKAVPLYIVGLGSDRPVRDLDLGDLLVDEVVFVNDFVDFDFEITPTGLEGKSIELVLREKGSDILLDRQPASSGPRPLK